MTTANISASGKPPFTSVKWLICIISAIGFAFDTYSLIMLQFIGGPAVEDLGGFKPGSPEAGRWLGLLFYVPAVFGGVFGLLGGWLTDRLGRRRILTWSILLYAFATFASGYATSLRMLLILRSLTFIGVCVEFVAAIAWIAELFEDRKQRERALGYTQAFGSLGGLMVAGVNSFAIRHAAGLPGLEVPSALRSVLGAINDPHVAWRYTLLSGLIPAIPLILIRPFLPESPAWQAKRASGTLRRPSFFEIFRPDLRRTSIVSTIMFACSFGAAFGAIQQMTRIVPVLTEVRAEKAKAAKEGQGIKELKKIEQAAGAEYGELQEIGGLIGRFLLAALALRILSRRRLLRLFQVPGLLVMPAFFWALGTYDNGVIFHLGSVAVNWAEVGIFFCGLFTVAQFSFWGNYLPYVYPLHLRGTGEGFSANIGGRMIGTFFALVTTTIATSIPVTHHLPDTATQAQIAAATAVALARNYAFTAAGVALFVYLVGSIACFWLPEPKALDLSE
jgi:MFS family permease